MQTHRRAVALLAIIVPVVLTAIDRDATAQVYPISATQVSPISASQPATAPKLPPDDAASALRRLVDEAWDWEVGQDPLLATAVADPRGQDRLPDDSPAAVADRAKRRGEFLQRLTAINAEGLDPASLADREVLRRRLQDAIDEYRFGSHLMPINNRSGFHVYLAELAQSMRLESRDDFANYIARLKDFPRYFDQQIAWMRAGVTQGLTMPAVILREVPSQVEAHVVEKPEASLLYRPLLEPRPPAISAEDWSQLQIAAADAIRSAVVPAFAKLHDFLRDEYLPNCRGTIAARALPQGAEYYAGRVRHFTTLELTPQQVHEIGQSEVRRIRGEMTTVMRKTGFEGDLKDFVAKLRTDPQHYARTPEELLQFAAAICKRIDGELPRLFSRLPRTPYGIKPVPDFIAPQTTTAYYWPPAADFTRAGFFYLNTYNLSARPKYELEALAMHEAVPGHHLQIALQQELADLHPIRRYTGFTSFVEGWGLYAESLGSEMGFYQDPYQDFGRLSMEAWRACRLVVDTGMHALGWSREEAIAFMTENTALAGHNVVAEVDRYIGWPGQALGYKIGQLKISELRAQAQAKLGPRFDIREFHDVVLAQGAIPLDLLTDNVNRWVASKE